MHPPLSRQAGTLCRCQCRCCQRCPVERSRRRLWRATSPQGCADHLSKIIHDELLKCCYILEQFPRRQAESTGHKRGQRDLTDVGSLPPNVAMVPVDSDFRADVPKAACCGILMSVAVGMTNEASKIPRSGIANGTMSCSRGNTDCISARRV